MSSDSVKLSAGKVGFLNDTTPHASIQSTAVNTLELKDSTDGTTDAVELKNLAPPTSEKSAINRNYIDGLSMKQAVYAATAATVTTTSAPSGTIVLANGEGGFNSTNDTLTLDGVSVPTGSRILVRNNVGTSGSEAAIYQGIFTVGALDGATCTLTRATDMDSTAEAKIGSTVFVTYGTTYGGKTFYVSTAPATLNTNAFAWTQVSAGSGFDTAGDGLTSSGTTVNVVGTTDRISVSADAVDIASGYVGQTSITTLGTVATGTWQGTAIANAYVADDLTISGGTINNSAIGASTPSSGAFTTLSATSTLGVTGASTLAAVTASGLITANAHLKMGASQLIQDANGNEVLDFGATSSAVSNIKITNAAAANPPIISAVSDNASVGMDLLVKGSGKLAFTKSTNSGKVEVNVAGKIAGETCTLAFTAGASHTLTFPAGDDTLVGRATTDTLTNKTLTSPTINTATIAGGTLNNCVIGGSVPVAGSFTTLSASSTSTLTGLVTATAGVKFGSNTSIKDAGDAKLIEFPATVSSAENYVKVTNAATGTGPLIEATGPNDTDVPLRLQGKGAGRVTCTSNLLVPEDGYIGTSSSTQLMKLDGSATTVTITGTLTQTSDLRYKRNVRDCGGLAFVDQLRGVAWEWRKDLMSKRVDELDDGDESEEHEDEDQNNTSAGVVAQELQLVLPYAVQTGEDGKLSVNYSALHGVAINAIKELSARVRVLEAQVAELTKDKKKKDVPRTSAQYNLRPRSSGK